MARIEWGAGGKDLPVLVLALEGVLISKLLALAVQVDERGMG